LPWRLGDGDIRRQRRPLRRPGNRRRRRLAALLYTDAVVSPFGTGLLYTASSARLSYALGRQGFVPTLLRWVSGRGVPWVSIVFACAAGCVFFLPFPGWQSLVGFVTSATVLMYASAPLSLAALRR